MERRFAGVTCTIVIIKVEIDGFGKNTIAEIDTVGAPCTLGEKGDGCVAVANGLLVAVLPFQRDCH